MSCWQTAAEQMCWRCLRFPWDGPCGCSYLGAEDVGDEVVNAVPFGASGLPLG